MMRVSHTVADACRAIVECVACVIVALLPAAGLAQGAGWAGSNSVETDAPARVSPGLRDTDDTDAGPGTTAGESLTLDDLTGALPRPTHLSDELLEEIGERIGPAVFEVRTETDLGPHFRPRMASGSGAATWVRLGDSGPTVLLTAFAHVAQAATVEVRVGDTWHPAEVAHGTPMFDLAVLDVDAELDPAVALPLAERWSLGPTVYCPAGAPADGEVPAIVLGGIGEPAADYPYYVRALFTHHNGYPVVSEDGQLLAITSLLAGDGGGGALAIPFPHVRTWWGEWPQLDTSSPIGWEPRVDRRAMDLTSGRGALAD